MTTPETLEDVKRQVLASRISNVRSLNNEAALKWELARFFQDLQDKVLKELEEYYPDDETGIFLEGHIDLILAPIFESQKKYYRILRRFNSKEYTLGANEGKRLVKIARKYSNGASKSQTIKIDSLMDSTIKKDTLFGTQDWSRDKLLNQSFTASEYTMNRVDKDINKILADGYTSGKGIKVVREDIVKRFGQLADWEANRIARTEIHNAHQMGIMNTYQEMGVEYTQWVSAHDSRVRGLKPKDKADHVKMDGEIIPLGGTYSNGLQYPGDTKGPLYEWINCRCGNVPYIIPDGYMAPPGKAQFRESDLVQTLDYWNQDDLIAQATQEVSIEGNPLERQLAEVQRSTVEWDINRLTPQERERYLKIKNNEIILTEAIENQNFELLKHLDEDVGFLVPDESLFWELTYEGKGKPLDFEMVKDELIELRDDLRDYEKIIKDTNIEADMVERIIKWHNPGNKEYTIINADGETVPFNTTEKFVKYHFKKEGLTIYESVDMDTSRVRAISSKYEKIPKNLKLASEVVLSAQKPMIVDMLGSPSYVGGYVLEQKGSTRIYAFKKSVNDLYDNLIHENAHLLERDKNFYISNSKEYILAFKKDQQRLLKQGYSLEESYVTPYAHNFTEEFIKNPDSAIYRYGNRQYSEDFAESVKKYLRDPKTFAEKYPNKTKVIEKAIKGEYTPKNTTPYKDWLKAERNRFTLTEKEFQREQELRWKGNNLSSSERKELEYLQDKKSIDYVYNKKLEGELLDNAEEKAFEELTKKWNKKLKLPNENILELSDSNYTNKASKFTFTREDKLKYDELQKLKQEKQLGFSNRKKLELLETQKELDSLHQKFIKKGKLSSKEAKRYKELYNNIKIQKKFKLEILDNTAKLEGKSISPVIKDNQYTGDMNDPKNIKQFKGTTSDGMLPGNESIDRYFTKNVTTTAKYDEFIYKWVYERGYRDVQLFEECDKNIDTLRKVIRKGNKKRSEKWVDNTVNNIVEYYKQYENLMDGAETKKNIKFFRKQTELHISDKDLKKRKVILSARSMSISEEGREHYSNKSKQFKWNLEIQIPAGGNCVYIAPKAKSKKHNDKFIEQMETILGSDVECDIIDIVYGKEINEIVLRVRV